MPVERVSPRLGQGRGRGQRAHAAIAAASGSSPLGGSALQAILCQWRLVGGQRPRAELSDLSQLGSSDRAGLRGLEGALL